MEKTLCKNCKHCYKPFMPNFFWGSHSWLCKVRTMVNNTDGSKVMHHCEMINDGECKFYESNGTWLRMG